MASSATTAAFQSSTAASSNLSTPSIPTSPFNSDEANPKPSYSSKAANGKARQLEGAATAASVQRQPSTTKAWGSSLNTPGTRPSASNQRNGTSSHIQGTTIGPNPPLLREGLKIKITLDDGAEYEGTYSSGTESTYTLKMVQQKKLSNAGEMSNGTAKTGREQSSMSFQKNNVADVHVIGTALPIRSNRSQNGNSNVFRTDTAISGNRFHGGERPLKPWVADDNINTDMSLESSSNRTTGGEGWDQFEVNKRLFGVETDYDENIYTTTIDKSHPEYHKRYAEADRKAREIEGTNANNPHVAEERIVDNVTVDDSGLDEEDKYSGVHRQDFPPLAPSSRSNKYTPPGRRPAVAQLTSNSTLTDPAIISSSLARKESPAGEKAKNSVTQTSEMSETAQPEVKIPAQAPEVKSAATPEAKATTTDSSASASRTASPQVRPGGTSNATATVERDVVNAFKGFAAQQRSQADRLRSNKAKADKEVKLHELKKFAASFKLNSPVPSDLVSIIAKDPAKQREIQEKAKRDAEEQAEKAKQAKFSSAETTSSASPVPDPKPAQRPAAGLTHGVTSTPGPSNRQGVGRAPGFAPQGPYNSQSFRSDRPTQHQPIPSQNGRPIQGLGARLRSLEQSKSAQISPQIPPHEVRQPPTGPANSLDPSFSRRSSGAISMISNKMNPNSLEFRPNPFAATFNPNGNRSTGSSPRSNSTSAPNQLILVPSSTLVRRKPSQAARKSLGRKSAENYNDIIENIATIQPPQGVGKKWEGNGGVKPPYDTLPTWRQIGDKEPAESLMHQSYAKLFEENFPYAAQTMSPPQPPHVHPQVPHQHQLPFHLQQGPHNMSQRQSPRQPQMHLHNNQHGHGPNAIFNPADDHRMMPSHSAQSFASPRLQSVGMAYPSPMGQPAQLAYNQPVIQYPMGPGAPQMSQYRSYSSGHQFIPQQATHMAGPVMIPAPTGNGFMAPGMVAPAPQMIYPGGQPHFIPQGNGPPPMPGSNGYPSPGRSAPMMMQQGSQQGQTVYGMSPGMQYGQPMYAQQQPGQMPNMRYGSQSQPFGTSPQMHQYGPPSRGAPSGSYNNKNYMPQHGPHPPAPQNQIPTGPQSRPLDGVDDTK